MEMFLDYNYFNIKNLKELSFDEVSRNYEAMDPVSFFMFFNVFVKFPWIQDFDTRYNFLKHAQMLSDLNINDETETVYMKIRRDHMVEDGLNIFTCLLKSNTSLRAKFKITFIDSYGHIEPGIDDGGLFKEFLLQVLKTLLNPEYGLFITVNGDELIPNPQAELYVGGNISQYYYLLGVILARALNENI